MTYKDVIEDFKNKCNRDCAVAIADDVTELKKILQNTTRVVAE